MKKIMMALVVTLMAGASSAATGTEYYSCLDNKNADLGEIALEATFTDENPYTPDMSMVVMGATIQLQPGQVEIIAGNGGSFTARFDVEQLKGRVITCTKVAPKK